MNYPIEHKLTAEEIEEFTPIVFEGNIILVDTPEKLEDCLTDLNNSKILGFDTETRPVYKKGQYHPISLIQLANEVNAYLIQIKYTNFSEGLVSIFESESIEKVGIAINDDVKGLQKLQNFNPQGFVSLDNMAKKRGIIQTGARSLVARFMQRKLSKAARKSDWSRKELSKRQKVYAATDAWIGVKLYPYLQNLEGKE